jgi:peptidyl-prolyl cis-trans isomerase SurA
MKLFSAIAIILVVCYSVVAQEPIESIIAIVGDEPISSSELAAQIQLMAIQEGIRPKNEAELKKFRDDVLQDLIMEKLLLIEARKDTMISVTADQINAGVDNHIANLMAQFPSEEAFLDELAREGMTLRSFRKKMLPEMENQLYKQQLINQKVSSISISNQEVYDFYEIYKDSIPDQPEAVRLSHILITFQPSGGTEDSIRQKAEQIRTNAADGADFATMAITQSDGPSAINGGDLGFISRDDVVPEFGRVAFNLSPGQISGVVRTIYGFHIIKCEEKQGNRARFRQILFEIQPTAADSALSYGLVDSLISEIESETDFRELAKVFSADDDSRKQGGELGWFAIGDLPASFIDGVRSIEEINDIYGPVKSQYGLHILKLLERQEGREISLEEDFDKIKNMARQSKTGETVDEWIEEIKKRVYVEIRSFDL